MKMAYSTPYFREHPFDQAEAVTFVLPPYMNTIEVVPDPIDQRIQINKIEAGYWAVYPFRQNYNKARGAEIIQKLITELTESWIINYPVRKQDIIIAQYSEQLIPGFLKRNEVWIKVASKDKKL